jgi:hypothetical protein
MGGSAGGAEMNLTVEQWLQELPDKEKFPSRQNTNLVMAVRDYDHGAEFDVVIQALAKAAAFYRLEIGEEHYQAVVDACREYDRGTPYARKEVAE